MEKAYYECKICGKQVSQNNSYIVSHVRRKHKIEFVDYLRDYENGKKYLYDSTDLLYVPYIFKNFKNLNPEFELQTCGFCDRTAKPHLVLDRKNKFYEFKYDNGYACGTKECKENISQLILKCELNDNFEFIGSNIEYISKLHKRSVSDVKFSKSKGFREMKFKTTLKCFIEKYGEAEGTRRFEDRRRKISRANTLEYFVERHGEAEGLVKYNETRVKINSNLGRSKSGLSVLLEKFLKENSINYVPEWKFPYKGKNSRVDFYFPDSGIALEIFGDFWHANPIVYNDQYFNKILKLHASDIRERDESRLSAIRALPEIKKVIVVWEMDFDLRKIMESIIQ